MTSSTTETPLFCSIVVVVLPCLSFDVIPDNLGDNRTDFPATCYCIAGSQADKTDKNSLLVMKMFNLTAMKVHESDEEDEDSDSEDMPELECAQIRHHGSVNRVKVGWKGISNSCLY